MRTHFQSRPIEVGGSVRDRSTEQPGAMGAEATNRRDGRISGRGQLHRHPEARVPGHILGLREARLSPLLGRVHPHGLELRHPGLGRKRLVFS